METVAFQDDYVARAALLFEGGVSNDTTLAIFRKLDNSKKVQVYLKMIEKELDPSWKWEKFGYSLPMSHPHSHSLDVIVSNEMSTVSIFQSRFPKEIIEAYKVYKEKVGGKLAAAFRNDVKQPHMDSLVQAATACGFTGTPNDVLLSLAPHLKREKDRIVREFDRPGQGEVDRQVQYHRDLLKERLHKAWGMLLRPEERIKKQFQKAMSKLDSPESSSQDPVAALPAQPPALPPALPSVDEYLRKHIRPRTDCDKCEVARGPDASVRTGFATDGGNGRARNINAKRACPLACHAISAKSDGVPLLEKYEVDYGVKLTNKKQRICTFMKEEYNVERIGQAPHYKVTLYDPPHVDVDVACEGEGINLRLTAVGFNATSIQGTKDNFMGFMIV